MKKTTYKVKQLDRNTQTIDSDGNRGPVYRWECDHNHRTLRGAVRCFLSLSGTTRYIDAGIYASDGTDVDEYETYQIEYELSGRC